MNLAALFFSLESSRLIELLLISSSALQISFLLFVAGFSTALGHSGVLFLNRISSIRFIVSLFAATALYLAKFILWFGVLYAAVLVLKLEPKMSLLSALAFSRIPDLLGFLIFTPMLGIVFSTFLALASFLLTVYLLAISLSLNLAWAFLLAAGGVLCVSLLHRLFAKKLYSYAEQLRTKILGISKVQIDLDPKDLLEELGLVESQV